MSNFRKITMLALVAAVFSLGTVGCQSGDKATSVEQTKTEPAKREAPKGDHPKH